MKKLLLLFLSVVLIHSVVRADDGVPVTMDKLPATAQRLIKTHFSTSDIAYIQMEREWVSKSYEVAFVNGNKIDFDHKGNWTELNCKFTQVPDALVPKAIRNYVSRNHSGRTIRKMEREGNYFDIELDNGLEIKFNKQFKVVKIGD